MRTLKQIARPPLLLAILLLAAGCEDNGVIAPSDGQLIMTANPTTVVIDDDAGETEGRTTITAQLFDTNGFPLEGVDITFTTSSGSLASAPPGETPTPVTTNANGFASDVLTLTLLDDSTVDVGASSGTLSGSVQVTLRVGSDNVPPVAFILAYPDGAQQKMEQARFTGELSSDPDGAGVTCYKWTVSPAPSGATYAIWQGTGQEQVGVTYDDEEQNVTVTLRVSDSTDAASWCLDAQCEGSTSNACGAESSAFNGVDQINYQIVCDLTPPVPDPGTDQGVTLVNGLAEVTLSGINSSEPDNSIVAYTWECGNGSAPQSGADWEVVCSYTAVGTYTARLTVENECGDTAQDTVTVTVGL